MPDDTGWIESTDQELIDSVIRHEGDKPTIYEMFRSGTLKAAPGCDAKVCMDNNTWPAYLDREGLPTVGIGHLITGNESYDPLAGITDEQAKDQLSEDLERKLAGAKRLSAAWGMNIAGNLVVQRFMTEMCFNLGEGSYSNFRNGLRKLASAVNQDGQFTYNDAADEHLDSKWARQVGSRTTEMVDTLRELDG
jgi:GH24 family phage-related lysozyme (muramidase)